jgi:hypothetical protein
MMCSISTAETFTFTVLIVPFVPTALLATQQLAGNRVFCPQRNLTGCGQEKWWGKPRAKPFTPCGAMETVEPVSRKGKSGSHPEGIAALSPGLAAPADYPGAGFQHSFNTNGVVSFAARRQGYGTLSGYAAIGASPRVARSSQPRAERLNPVGIHRVEIAGPCALARARKSIPLAHSVHSRHSVRLSC